MFGRIGRILNAALILSVLLVPMMGMGSVAAAPQPPQTENATPVAIGAYQSDVRHLVRPREEVVMSDLQEAGVLAPDASEAQAKAAVEAYYADFSKRYGDGIPASKAAWNIQREVQLTTPGVRAMAIQPVTATVFALAVDFSATEVLSVTPCITETTVVTGPMQGIMPHPGPNDNETLWFSPTLTADPMFYNNLVFGYEGLPRARYDLVDPVDGQPGINLAGYTVQDYYDQIAGDGNFYITGTIDGWITVPHSEGYYGATRFNPDCSWNDNDGGIARVGQLVIDALNIYSTTHATYYNDTGADAFWPKYDANQDGLLDTMWIVHAGEGEESGGGEQGAYAIWSHSWALSSQNLSYKVYEGDPITTTDDIYVNRYTMQPENLDLGVLVEEFGHNFFGLPDMYTTDAQNSVGFWNTMSSGSYGGYLAGTAPAGMPLWFRMIAAYAGPGGQYVALNWQEPMVTWEYGAPAGDVTIGALEGTPAGVNKGIRVNLPDNTKSFANVLDSGKAAWSGNALNNADLTLTRQIAVPAGVQHTLTFTSAWDIELDYDYGYVMINGIMIPDANGVFTDTNPNGSSLGWGLTGTGEGVLEFDLSDYAGQTITLTLRYVTDGGTLNDGWWIDDIKLDGTLLEDFETATAPSTFSGWTNSTPGWSVVPLVNTFTHYYLVEWRAKTKYDKMVQTAYITTDYDANGWRVERIPYNIPGALVYYRDTRFPPRGYAQRGFYADSPSFGPKNKILLVDMNYQPMRVTPTSATIFNARSASYDAALTLQPTEAFTITRANGIVTPAGPYFFPAKPAVEAFDDSKGYYAGFFAGAPCTSFMCYANRDGSVVIPARGMYSTRITAFDETPYPDYYGVPMSWFGLGDSWLGSGNPGDNNVQYGVNFALVSKAGDDAYSSTAVIHFGEVDGAYHASVNPAEIKSNAAATHYITYTMVLDNANIGNTLPQERRFEYVLDPSVDFVSSSWQTGTVILPTPGTLMKTPLMWAGVLQPGEMMTFTTVVSATVQQGEARGITTTVRHDDYMNEIETVDLVTNVVVGTRYLYLPMVLRGYPAP